ncbi:MAG: deoxyribonuclease IV [Candidatus Andersenbacteria bacterium]|nr:deoxyribonuclease IV [Candidatus Andersenbacteria bacterium]
MTSGQRIGLHVSAAGGLENAPLRAKEDFDAECFQFFSRSPRGGGTPPISEETARMFRENAEKFGFESYIHTPYYINFASKNKRVFYGSAAAVRQELERGSTLGVKYVVTHMGSAKEWVEDPKATATPAKALEQAIKGLKAIYEDSSKFSARLLLEISAGAGSVVGDTFEELGHLLSGLGRSDVHVCLDTAHLFASGYDVRTKKAWDETLQSLDKHVGLDNLKLIHVNDSKIDLGGRVDRHEHIGKGYIGKDGFKAMLAHKDLKKVNFILETKHDALIYEDIAFLKKNRKKS